MLFLRKGKTIGLNNKTHTNQQNPLFPNKWGMPDSVKVALHLMLYDMPLNKTVLTFSLGSIQPEQKSSHVKLFSI